MAITALALLACDLEESTPAATAAVPPATPGPSPQSTALPTLWPAGQPSATATWPAIAGELDGAAVLFERDGEIWALDALASQKRLLARGLRDASPFELGDPWALSADGQALVMARNLEGQTAVLTLLALPGGQPQEIGPFEGCVDGLRWSHDASQLAFLVSQRHEQTGELLAQTLSLYDRASRAKTVLYQCEFRPEEILRLGLWLEGWVPGDASLYVVYALEQSDDPGTLHALDVRGGEPRPVSTDYLLKGGQAISALTSEVLLRLRTAGQGGGRRASPVYVARAGLDGSLTQIRRLSPEDWFVGAVAWSPEGQRVVVERYQAQTHGTFEVHLWLLDLGGAPPRQLTADAAYRGSGPCGRLTGLRSSLTVGKPRARSAPAYGCWGSTPSRCSWTRRAPARSLPAGWSGPVATEQHGGCEHGRDHGHRRSAGRDQAREVYLSDFSLAHLSRGSAVGAADRFGAG